MHGLRLIKFPDNDHAPIEYSEKLVKSLQIKQQHPNTKNALVSQIFKTQVEIAPSLTDRKQSKSLVKRPIRKSFSEIFGKIAHDVPSTQDRKKLRSFMSLKRKVLSNTTLYTGKVKEKLINFREINKLKKKKGTQIKAPNEVEVLFKSKNWKSKRKHSQKPHHEEIRKYAIHYNSKSTCDLDRLRRKEKCRRNNKFCCRLNIPQIRRNNINTNSNNTNESGRHEYFRHFSSNHEIHSKYRGCHHIGHKLAETYNVVDFPYATANIQEVKNACEEPDNNTTRELDISYSNTNKQTSVNTSCFQYLKGEGDTKSSLYCQTISNIDNNLQDLKSKPHTEPARICKFKERKNKAVPKAPGCSLFIVKALKYTLFGFAIVIWSPCILIITLLWIITYPLRPQELINTINDVESCKCKSQADNDEDFWSSVYNCVVAAVQKMMVVYKAMFSLIKKRHKIDAHICRSHLSFSPLIGNNHSGKQYPNPTKKYKLFYDGDRGWVIKQLKPRKSTYIKKNRGTFHMFDYPFNDEKTLNKPCTPKKSEAICKMKLENNRLSKCREVSQVDHTSQSRDEEQQTNTKLDLCERDKIISIKKFSQETEDIPNDKYNDENDEQFHIDCNCDPNTNAHPLGTDSIWKPVQDIKPIAGHYQGNIHLDACRTNNVPVYSSLQKTQKFVTFDERMHPCLSHSNLYTKHVSENVLSPFNPDHYFKKHDISPEESKRTNKNNIMAPVCPSLRCSCKLKKTKHACCHHQKYEIPRNFYDHYSQKNVKDPLYPRHTRGTTSIKQSRCKSKCKNRILLFCRKLHKKTMRMVKDVDSKVWDYNCEDIYIQTLRKRPWPWVYRRWPTFYPYFLIFCKFYERLAYAMLYICTACIWCPVFCWCYICCNLFCRCVL